MPEVSSPYTEREWREVLEQIGATLDRAENGWPESPHIDEVRAAQQAASELAGLVRQLEEQLEAAQGENKRLRAIFLEIAPVMEQVGRWLQDAQVPTDAVMAGLARIEEAAVAALAASTPASGAEA